MHTCVFAGLMCEGDAAKQLFMREGGLDALLSVAARPFILPRVLAAVCTALLNLSSCVPAQAAIARRCMRLLLHINSQYSGLNGYSLGGSTALHAGASARGLAGPAGLDGEYSDEEAASVTEYSMGGRSTVRSAEAKDRPDTNAVSAGQGTLPEGGHGACLPAIYALVLSFMESIGCLGPSPRGSIYTPPPQTHNGLLGPHPLVQWR